MTDAELLLQAETLSGVGAWAWDGGPGPLHWSPQTFRLHGLPPGTPQPMLQRALQQVCDVDRARVDFALHDACGPRRCVDLRFALQLPDGRLQRVRLTARWTEHGTPTPLLVGTLRAVVELDVAPLLRSHPLEYAVAAAGVGVWEMDMLTGEESWSDLTLALYGLPPGSTAPMRSEWRQRFLHPEDLERVDARAAEMLAGGRPYEMDYRIRRADNGALRWLHSRAAFAFGGQRRVLGVTFDITERRLAELQARESARLLDLAATHVGFGFGYREQGGDAGEWSPQLKRLFGLSPQAATPAGEQLLALVSERDRSRVLHELSRPIPPGGISEFEFEVDRGADGRPRTLRTRAVTVRDEHDAPHRTYFAVVDLSEMRRQDRRVADLLDRLKLATEASGVGTWERNELTDEVCWDVITLGLFGLPADAPAPDFDQYLALVHPDDRDRVRGEWARVEAEPLPLDIEYRVIGPGGSERWLQSRGRVERDASGRVVRRIGVCFDTTGRRQAEAALQARALAEQANAAKTEFLSRMSHELRTPLNAVLGFAQLMALDHGDPLSDAQRVRIGHVQAAGWHLLALVNDVLDLASIESRQAQMVFSRVALAEVVHECLAMTQALAAPRRIALQWRAGPDTPAQVWADRTRLKQVLLNLISNAVKYNRDDGRVDVSARLLPTGPVQITVLDTGLGLTPEQQARLFEPFNRLGREASGIEGSGIGLALSKLIVEQMGGSIDAQGTVGVGSEFRVQLPAVAAP